MDQWISGSVDVRVDRSDQEMISRPLKQKVWPLLFVTAISLFYCCTPIYYIIINIAQPDLIYFSNYLFICTPVHHALNTDTVRVWQMVSNTNISLLLTQMKLLVIPQASTIVLKMILSIVLLSLSVYSSIYTHHLKVNLVILK